jgi:hypothetical protein
LSSAIHPTPILAQRQAREPSCARQSACLNRWRKLAAISACLVGGQHDDLYDADIVVWSEDQAALLRRLAAGERVNDQVDWANVIEEIESVGNEQIHAVSSLLTQAIIHRLKAMGWLDAIDADNWRADAARFAGDAADRFAPSMRQRLDLAKIYRRARRGVPATMYGRPYPPMATECPWSLDELLAVDSD